MAEVIAQYGSNCLSVHTSSWKTESPGRSAYGWWSSVLHDRSSTHGNRFPALIHVRLHIGWLMAKKSIRTLLNCSSIWIARKSATRVRANDALLSVCMFLLSWTWPSLLFTRSHQPGQVDTVNIPMGKLRSFVVQLNIGLLLSERH